ncbi:hypothetical protein K402DRAFT_421795 [Aulographum hederae CBS 113979]|uniref:Uncharacterized protein n=1 Tax=Aulographum hederae CBS 113979 TaxID=1176131 RepID=A0A6G1GYJ9_9PEZI|nr:hypothetical protein K402DRAFT_421795 [Aulographum hederae CBS 113979]
MGFIEKLQAKLEIYRLEQRYTRGRDKRSTFTSDAQYINGEYVYSSPSAATPSGSANSSDTGSRERCGRWTPRRRPLGMRSMSSRW